jgi:hypothetical protein
MMVFIFWRATESCPSSSPLTTPSRAQRRVSRSSSPAQSSPHSDIITVFENFFLDDLRFGKIRFVVAQLATAFDFIQPQFHSISSSRSPAAAEATDSHSHYLATRMLHIPESQLLDTAATVDGTLSGKILSVLGY